MESKKILILIILGAIATLLWANSLERIVRQGREAIPTPSIKVTSQAPSVSIASKSEQAVERAIVPKREVKGTWGRDPFSPFVGRLNLKKPASTLKPGPSPRVNLDSLTLTGTVQRGERLAAIINDRVVRIGDVIANLKVIEIKRNMVILTDGLEKYTLKFKGE